MNGDNNRKTDHETLREEWIAALLRSLLPCNHSERINRAMNRLGTELPTGPDLQSDEAHREKRLPRWSLMATASTVLISAVVLYQFVGRPSPAMAAVKRSLHAISRLVPRKYDLEVVTNSPQHGRRTVRNEVFVQGLDRFVVRNTRLGEFWLGRSALDSYWIVPPRGNVFKGTSLAFYDLLDARAEGLELPKLPRHTRNTPFLHVATALQIMSQRCQLTKLPDEVIELSNGREVVCQHIKGKPRGGPTQNPPESIDIWISGELDIPIKVIAKWKTEITEVEKFPIASIILSYQGQPELPSDWFTAEGHYEGVREIKNIE